MASDPTPGRSLVSRRAIADIVRTATIGSYGVAGFAGSSLARSPIGRLATALGLGQPGLRVRLGGDEIRIRLDLTIAYGLPVAEVVRQVDSAVRYALRRAVGRDIDVLEIHVGGLRLRPAGLPPPARFHATGDETGHDERADGGSDVA